ncbi:hypothetical protein ACFPES_25630 [Paenibacillus sp. GCM10023248]|nr:MULTISPECIES: hypothetical protein [Bacillales]MDD9270440.1 hypothetical protein [Paenibacillus sp. MAHUQ-63]MDR6884193.1 hypothetical protein [Bacillus sp. 3255]
MQDEIDRTWSTQREITARTAETENDQDYDLIRAYADQLNGELDSPEE